MDYPPFILFLLLFGAGFILNMGLARFWVRPFDGIQRTAAALLLVIGLFQLLFACFVAGWTHDWPHLALLHVPLLLATGPLLALYFYQLVQGEPYPGKIWPHALPLGLALVLLLPFLLLDAETKLLFLHGENPPGDRHAWIFTIARIMLPAGFVSIVGYSVFLLRRGFFLLRESFRSENRFLRVVVAMITVVSLCGLFGFVGQIFDIRLKASGSLATSLAFIYLYHISHRYPRFLPALQEEIKRARYVHSRLSGVNVSAVLERLRVLMESERVYRDETLSLEDLGARLELKPGQLTEVLNLHAGQGFYSYVNHYRIQEAKELLRSQRELSILRIAYAAGFNSKSVFYESFRKETGLTPKQFRQNETPKEPS